jgi:hypothetical protein
MRNLIIFAALVIGLSGCQKQEVSPLAKVNVQAEAKAKLIGTWLNAHEIVHYTDNTGASKTFDDGVINRFVIDDSQIIKYHGVSKEFTATYTVSSDGASIIMSVVNTSTVYTYKINTLTSATLSVTGPTMPTWSGYTNGITYTGTNAYYEETYTR